MNAVQMPPHTPREKPAPPVEVKHKRELRDELMNALASAPGFKRPTICSLNALVEVALEHGVPSRAEREARESGAQ